jgi:hypothetical protein
VSERKNLPSASALHRYASCPGSFLLEQTFPEEESSPYAIAGNRIHAALAGEPVDSPLSDEEARIVESCQIQEAALVSETLGDIGVETVRERRLWAFDDDLNHRWSGKPDAVHLDRANGVAVVVDYKTGRGEVAHATGNLQLRALAVLVRQTWDVSTILVAIIQPLAGPPSVCRYTDADLIQAESEVNGVMDLALTPGQPRNPSSDACKYCRAKASCPEAIALVEAMPLQVSRDGHKILITPERMADFLELVPAVEAIIEAVKGRAKRLLEEDPNAVPGWTLKPGTARESITQPETVFGRFLEAGGKPEQFMPCVTLAKTKFKDAVRAATGEKGRALDQRIEGLLEGCTETKASAPSLVKLRESAP